jgi:hypothetical protein
LDNEKWYGTACLLFTYKELIEMSSTMEGRIQYKTHQLALVRNFYKHTFSGGGRAIMLFDEALERRPGPDEYDIISIESIISTPHIVPSFSKDHTLDRKYFYVVPNPVP